MDNHDRGINFIPLDLNTAKVYVFVDASFANNEDLSSQIGFLIMIGNETNQNVTATITKQDSILRGNLIHWSSTKSKRITRSVLAAKIHGMTAGADIVYIITSTINLILQRLQLKPIPIVICTDSFSLYECIVKLGLIKEKRLMIDIMALR